MTGENVVCAFCNKRFSRASNLKYHIANGVCTGRNAYDEFSSMSDEKLRLIIELKSREVELARLNLAQRQLDTDSGNVEVNSQQRHCGSREVYAGTIERQSKTLIKLRWKPGRKPGAHRRNFGEENCQVFQEIRISPDLDFIGQRLLKALHFNPKYPENHNLAVTNPESDHIEVYVDDEWKSVYSLAVIDEYLRGNLARIEQLSPGPIGQQLRDNVVKNIDQLHQLCRATIGGACCPP